MTDRDARSLAPTPTRCVAHTRLYRDGRLVESGFDVEQVSDHLADGDSVVWLDLLQPDENDMAVLVAELGLHPLAIEDALHAHQRPKLDRYEDHLFLAAYGVRLEAGELRAGEVAAFITRRALVTVRKSGDIALEPVLARWDASPELAAAGVPFLVHGLVDVLVDGYETVLRELDDAGEDLEDSLFDDRSRDQDLQRQSYAIRTALSRLRRVALPMRDVVGGLRRHDNGFAGRDVEPYFRDVDDHLQRVLEGVETLRDLLSTVLETTLAVQGQRLNQTIFRLTAYAAVLAVTTAITGYYGQNIPYPGLGERSGFLSSTALLVLSVGGLLVYFKRKGWL
jgi:magnesium transporter